MTVSIEAATADRWPDVVRAFGRAKKNPDSCWCQRLVTHDRATNEDALHHEVTHAKVPVGLVAYDDDEPVGWSRVVPRDQLPGVMGNRSLRRLLEDDSAAWWVACLNIQSNARGKGIGVALLYAAIRHAREQGASVLDGHPVDLVMSEKRPSPSALFTGTRSIFLSAGFEEIGRTFPSRPVMRISLR